MPVYTMDSLVDGVSLVRSVVGLVFWLLLLVLVGVDLTVIDRRNRRFWITFLGRFLRP